MEIVEFLRARLDADEQLARAVSAFLPSPWSARTDQGVFDREGLPVACFEVCEESVDDETGPIGIDPQVADHIARWHPARVLAEVEAKRAVISTAWGCPGCGGHDNIAHGCPGMRDQMEHTIRPDDPTDPWAHILRSLARPYAQHPDFDAAWKVGE